jgi:hypothetical protein
MKTLLLAWREPVNQKWCPIGRLIHKGGLYVFAYTKGAAALASASTFVPVPSFERLDAIYYSEELFPVFANRLLPTTRPDYQDFLLYLGVEESGGVDPLAILDKSGGRKATDNYEVFSIPDRGPDGTYEFDFFAHGLRYLPEPSKQRVEKLKVGDDLLLALDVQNPHDTDAVLMRTNDLEESDRFIVGYCPRYLSKDVSEGLKFRPTSANLRVLRLNQPPAPMQYRLRCRLTMTWPSDQVPFSDPRFEPIVSELAASAETV